MQMCVTCSFSFVLARHNYVSHIIKWSIKSTQQMRSGKMATLSTLMMLTPCQSIRPTGTCVLNFRRRSWKTEPEKKQCAHNYFKLTTVFNLMSYDLYFRHLEFFIFELIDFECILIKSDVRQRYITDLSLYLSTTFFFKS